MGDIWDSCTTSTVVLRYPTCELELPICQTAQTDSSGRRGMRMLWTYLGRCYFGNNGKSAGTVSSRQVPGERSRSTYLLRRGTINPRHHTLRRAYRPRDTFRFACLTCCEHFRPLGGMFHAVQCYQRPVGCIDYDARARRELSLGSGGVRCRIVTAAFKELIMRISR